MKNSYSVVIVRIKTMEVQLMSLLKSALKYKAAKTVTDKVVGKGAVSTIAAASMVKQSNQRGKAKRAKKQ